MSFDNELLDPSQSIAYYINELDLEDGEMLTVTLKSLVSSSGRELSQVNSVKNTVPLSVVPSQQQQHNHPSTPLLEDTLILLQLKAGRITSLIQVTKVCLYLK